MIQSAQAPELLQLPVAQLQESPLNPRRHFSVDALAELSSSIRKVGILTPLIARPNGEHYELAAGHRRLRAAKMAGLLTAPVLVRAMDDATFLEVMTVDNLQRDDLHPLEEAQGFRSLMEASIGYNIGKIAERTGRSVSYVYDRLKLLRLAPLAQELFLENRFTVAHAVILARLTPDLQEIAIDPSLGGMFERDQATLFDGVRQAEQDAADLNDADPEEEERLIDARHERMHATRFERVKPCSVRELQRWVDTHVRFDPSGEDVPMLFPETELALSQADAAAAKVVEISYQQQVHDMAKVGGRILGPRSWRRAEETCDHAVLGVVVVGPHRGDAFEICTAKKKCLVHWSDLIRAEQAAEREAVVSPERAASENTWKKQLEKEQAERNEWDAAQPAIEEAFVAALKKASTKAGSPAAQMIIALVKRRHAGDEAMELMPKPKTSDDLIRLVALAEVLGHCGYYQRHELKKSAKQFGVDVGGILKAQKKAAATNPAQKKGGK